MNVWVLLEKTNKNVGKGSVEEVVVKQGLCCLVQQKWKKRQKRWKKERERERERKNWKEKEKFFFLLFLFSAADADADASSFQLFSSQNPDWKKYIIGKINSHFINLKLLLFIKNNEKVVKISLKKEKEERFPR